MEDDIKVLEDIRNEIETESSTLLYKNKKRKIQAIENLIARNKELEEKDKANEAIKKAYREVIDDKGYIPKSKVKEKLQELYDKADYRKPDNLKGRVHFQPEPVDFQIAVLQELLQEGDK